MSTFFRSWVHGAVAAVFISSLGCSTATAQTDRQLRDQSDGHDWAAFGRTYGEQHYSPLAQINVATVQKLGLAWTYDLPRGNTATGPLEIGGTFYVATGYSIIRALDARTGKQKWTYDSGAAAAAGRKLRQGWGIRGIAWSNGKIYTGTQDGRLIAINADTGKPVWTAMTVGKDDYRFISGPPRVFKGMVIIGHGGADAADTRGYVTAYDADTGKQIWRFYTVPGQPGVDQDETTQLASGTWAGEWWRYGGGGTVWNAMTYDEDLGQIYLGTGNGAPWNYQIRSQGKGDNLFLCSIVALDARTGKYKWHYQVNPGEAWDYNASMDIELAEAPIDGKNRKVLMTAPKNGFYYVIDRQTGKLLSANNYVDVTWAKGIDSTTGRPIEVPGTRYQEKPFYMLPGTLGAHSWHPMAYSPLTKLTYIPAMDMGATFSSEGIPTQNWKRAPNNLMDFGANISFDFTRSARGYLIAWDPWSQTERWRKTLPAFAGGGVVVTGGGLVFQGEVDGSFRAYSAIDGKVLWTFDAKSPVMGVPITFSVGGSQYVAVTTGMSPILSYWSPYLEKFGLDPSKQARRVMTFALGAEGKLPPTERGMAQIPDVTDFTLDTKKRTLGYQTYLGACSTCHGGNAVAVAVAPDLRASQIVRTRRAFSSVLKEGLLVTGGMPKFDDLTDDQIDAIQHYLLSRAVESRSQSH